MGPLPQTPNDIIVALTIMPFTPDQGAMCESCAHGDDTAEEVFRVINDCLNGGLSIEDTITTIRGVKARPIRKHGQQNIIGYQVDWSIIQEYPFSNDLITVSVYSQHVLIPHRECDYGHMVRATMISLGVCGSGPIGHITCLAVSLLGTIQTSLQPILS